MGAIDQQFTSKLRHQALFGLLYPAVLGAMLYALLPITSSILFSAQWHQLRDDKLILSVLVVSLFVIDYLYMTVFTEVVRATPRAAYNWVRLLVDLGVVLCLYVAFDAVALGREGETSTARLSGALAITFLLFLWWVWCYRSVLINRVALGAFEVVFFIMFVCLVVWPSEGVLMVTLGAACIGMTWLCGHETQQQWRSRANGIEPRAR